MRALKSVVIGASIAAAWAASAEAQGFTALAGAEKPKTVALKRILPATVNLNGRRISIQYLDVTAGSRNASQVRAAPMQGKLTQADLEILRTKLLTAIQKDSRFAETGPEQAETRLTFQVTEYYLEQRTHMVMNNQRCEVIVGKMDVSYQAKDRSGVPIDSENLVAALSEQPQKGTSVFAKLPGAHKNGACNTDSAVQSWNEARDNLFDSIVDQMTRRATATEETVIAPVPRGKLEGLSAIAASGRWETLLEETEKTDKLPKPQDDAYRVYLIGLANEGLAYDAARDATERERNRRNDMTSQAAQQSMVAEDKDFASAQDYIDKAAKAYKDAIQLKPGEKYFREPDARIEKAVKLYATIERHREEYRQAVLKKQGRPAVAQNADPSTPDTSKTGTRSVAPPSKSPSNTKAASSGAYDKVVSMCQQKVAGVAQLIHDHPGDLHFTKSLSFDQDLALRQACGADAPAIVNEINAQIRRNAPAGKKSGGE